AASRPGAGSCLVRDAPTGPPPPVRRRPGASLAASLRSAHSDPASTAASTLPGLRPVLLGSVLPWADLRGREAPAAPVPRGFARRPAPRRAGSSARLSTPWGPPLLCA